VIPSLDNRVRFVISSSNRLPSIIPIEGFKLFFSVSLILLLGAACVPASSQTTATADLLTTMDSISTASAPTIYPPASLTAQPGSSPCSAPSAFDLSVPIYILSKNQRGVWVLDPTALVVQRVSLPEWQVTAFDVSPIDGRMAYGTEDGELILVLPGESPRTVVDTREMTELPLRIRSLAWSPGGERLAYAVDLREGHVGADPAAEELAGVWVWNLEDGSRLHLLKNRYIPQGGDVNRMRGFGDPVWSPDGTGMILTALYWEWIDALWLDPVAPDLEGTNLQDAFEDLWGDASWARDGGSILVSRKLFSGYGDLYRVARGTLDIERLIDGEAEELLITHAFELPAGIAFVAYYDPSQSQLYLGSQTETGFAYLPAGPEGFLCRDMGPIGLRWDRDGRFALVACNHQWRVIALDGSLDLDLAPYLGALASEDRLELFWGAAKRG
jgi:hypothetical protein